ncbi:MAG TPA: ABC transporter ATP-binding protein [Thermoanaerobaculia bacterium]|jgi:ABC-2 type transport system ATP-binding protein|nr:ABC transporter ATP-binding protein [Thermoanaerobaculia bacterium]
MSASPEAPEAVVVVQGMTRRYGAVVAAEDVTFDVRRGEMFGLIGPDGAGKTTTLRVVLGLLAPNAGNVRTCGLEPVKQGSLLSRKIGYLSQRFSLYGDLTVDENVAFFASIHGVKGWKPRRDELLDLLRMTPFRGRLADRLSGGMKQKLALACTLIHTPELLVLDEPTTGVDPVSRRDFWKILAHLQRDGLTLLATTPYLDEAERCQRIALMDRGRLLTVDAPAHLKQESGEVIVEILARPKREASERLRERPEVADVQSFGERLHATLKGVDSANPEATEAAAARLAADLAAHGIAVESVRPVLPTLEDVFIARIEAEEVRAS